LDTVDHREGFPATLIRQGCIELLRSKLLNRLKPIHKRVRDQKIDLFLRHVGDCRRQARLLDVGGTPGIDGEFRRLHSSFAEVVIVNLHEQAFTSNGVAVKSIRADGCALPFRTNSFDWVFSNAVIEHVGNLMRQRRFADEIRRVAARGYFVATPNRHFPIEPHTLLPFYQFLPVAMQRRLVRLSPGYMREPYPVNLLSCSDMQFLFPEARVRGIGSRILPSSLVALYKAESQGEHEIT
jgi:Methyltransferase domain